MMCLLLSSCGNSIAKLESIVEDIKTDGKNWDADQWESVIRDVADLHIAFWESEPTKADIKAFDKLGDKFVKAVEKAAKSNKSQKALEKAYKVLNKDRDFKALNRKIEKMESKARKAVNKKSRRDDDEEEVDEEAGEDDESYDDEEDEDY